MTFISSTLGMTSYTILYSFARVTSGSRQPDSIQILPTSPGLCTEASRKPTHGAMNDACYNGRSLATAHQDGSVCLARPKHSRETNVSMIM